MKKIKFAMATLTAVAALTACSTPAPTSVIEFNYQVDNGKANGIVQVFDLSGNTVVQIRDLNPKTTHFLDSKNAPIAFKVMGESVVLTGMHSSFTVSTASAASRVVRKPTAPLPEPTTVTIATATGTKKLSAADSTATIETEITRIRKELLELKAMLAAAAPAREGRPAAPVAATAEQAGQPKAQVVIVSFANNSRNFNPADDQRSQLLAMSHNAERISIRGFTDSESATPGSVALARARAEAAKRYLLSMGVTARKIDVRYDGAGKFIADNRSAAGKAANRRVEIGGT